METVGDGRILSFVQELPPSSRAKVLLTSRQKTGRWELPIPVSELSVDEVCEFVQIRAGEMGMAFAHDPATCQKIWKASGGLPLAIQWILGKWKLTGSLDPTLDEVGQKDSPVLEFSFGNIWKVLSEDARAILAVMTIFEEPPAVQQLAIATEFQIERIESALAELCDVTLVTRHTQLSDGRTRYLALPITLSFARNQLETFGDFEVNCRRRFQKFNEQMTHQESEILRFRSRFERYSLDTDNEKRAAILCRRGESEMFVGNTENADMLFKQARDLAPQSAYVYAMSASYELARNRVGQALTFAKEGCRRVNKKTGGLCYTILARVLDVQRDRAGRVVALEKAVEYDPKDFVTRHQYGVPLSRCGRTEEAIAQFTLIIEEGKKRTFPTVQLLMALKTRMINFKRQGRRDELVDDLALADQIFSKYPHLITQAREFEEFRERPAA